MRTPARRLQNYGPTTTISSPMLPLHRGYYIGSIGATSNLSTQPWFYMILDIILLLSCIGVNWAGLTGA